MVAALRSNSEIAIHGQYIAITTAIDEYTEAIKSHYGISE